MQTLILMRYSYFGLSGWQSGASRDLDRLLSSERLAKRINLLENIALRSLADQTDEDFKLVVLSSRAMPKWRQRQLTSLCKDMLGDDRADVIFRRQGSAHAKFKNHIHENYGDAPLTCQVVLDDDDALASDFVEKLKPEAEAAIQNVSGRHAHTFMSFPEGVSLKLGQDGAQLFERDVPFTNLGLSLVAPTQAKFTVYGLAHKKVTRRHPTRVIYRQEPSYIRTVHDTNDSRAQHGDSAIPTADLPVMIARFPCLAQYFEAQLSTDVVKKAA